MIAIEYAGRRPTVDASAYVAPNAVLRGDVTIGAGSCVLFGAIISAEGGPVTVGRDCVIMENAVIRGTPRHPARLGNAVLVGPHAHLSGCTVDDEVFLATGATVFNGARVCRRSVVRIKGVVHVKALVPEEATVPIGWIAAGDPVEILPPDRIDRLGPIMKAMDFRGTVWGVDASWTLGEVTRRYAQGLLCHLQDRLISGPESAR